MYFLFWISYSIFHMLSFLFSLPFLYFLFCISNFVFSIFFSYFSYFVYPILYVLFWFPNFSLSCLFIPHFVFPMFVFFHDLNDDHLMQDLGLGDVCLPPNHPEAVRTPDLCDRFKKFEFSRFGLFLPFFAHFILLLLLLWASVFILNAFIVPAWSKFSNINICNKNKNVF